MQKEQFLFLIDRYINGVATDSERLLVETYYEKLQASEEAFITSEKEEQLKLMILGRVTADIAQSEVNDDKSAKLIRLTKWRWTAIAAAILILIGMAFWFNRTDLGGTARNIDYASKIQPGGNKAVLILEDGSRIDLDTAGNGVIAKQAGLKVEKTGDGLLVYSKSDMDDEANRDRTKYNTILTPRGGKYEITLSDGTKVWLNSASSLKYPSSFSGKERRIELKGEGYFEVSHDPSRPFIVSSDHQEVKVLGTHFNISAYEDDTYIKTTLLQGSVKVNATYLKPGQQATSSGRRIDVNEVDVERAVDWKNGYFLLKDEDLKTIMRKLARWYDIEVDYSGNVEGLTFGGRVSRARNLGVVLKMLSSTEDVKFKVVGRRVTVMP